MPDPAKTSWFIPGLVIFSSVVVFGVLVAIVTLRLRRDLRAEVLQREAEAIHGVALLELARTATLPPDVLEVDPLAAEFSAVLESSRLRGVLAVQLFDAEGRLQFALPQGGQDMTPWWTAAPERPLTRFQPDAKLADAVGGTATGQGHGVPLLEVVIPLRPPVATVTRATARYWLDGRSVAAEFDRMDRRLLRQAGLAYAGTALLVTLALVWALRRLTDANQQLAARSADLQRANEELNFAAKTGAIGTISAHLIHGLKNPIAGLEDFVAEGSSHESVPGEAWREAAATMRRLRGLVQEVSAVLREESAGGSDYAQPLDEILAAAAKRIHATAETAGVVLKWAPAPAVSLPARCGNLAILILDNLLRNAIEASVGGGVICVAVTVENGSACFRVSDQAGGLSPAVRARLFRPVASSKPNGSGIGLTISRQLARHVGGELELASSDATGTTFCLRVPAMAPEPISTPAERLG